MADKDGLSWNFQFMPISLRYVRAVIHEYRGEAVAINHVEIADSEKKVLHIPTEADLLSLSTNNILEIAGGADGLQGVVMGPLVTPFGRFEFDPKSLELKESGSLVPLRHRAGPAATGCACRPAPSTPPPRR